MKPPVVTTIDLQETKIRIAQLETKGANFSLSKFVSVGVIPPAKDGAETIADRLGTVLREILDCHRINTTHILTSIPRHLTIVRYLTLPSQNENEIREMVSFEAEKHLPFPINQLEMDIQILGSREEGTELILIAVQKEIIQQHLNILGKAGLEPEIIDLSSFALLNLYTYQEETPEGVTALINVEKEVMEVAVVEKQELRFSRSVLLKRKQNKETTFTSEIRDYIISELRRSFDVYRAEAPQQKITRLFLSASPSVQEMLLPELTNQFPMEIVPFEPLKHISISNETFQESSYPDNITTLVGLALRKLIPGSIGISLIPSELIEQKIAKRRRRTLLAGAISFAAVILLGLGFIWGSTQTNQARLKKVEQELAQWGSLASEKEELESQIEFLRSLTSPEGSVLEILREISLLASEDLYLTRFDFKKNDRVELTGRALSSPTINIFVDKLGRSKQFKKVELRRTSGRGKMWEFDIRCALREEKKR